MRFWEMKRLWRRFTRRSPNDIPKAAVAAGRRRRPKWSCACSFSNMSETGATRSLSAKSRPNLVYRDFTKVGAGKMPDAKTMGRWGLAVGPAVIEQVHARLIKIAQERGVVSGRRMRVDTTVVEPTSTIQR